MSFLPLGRHIVNNSVGQFGPQLFNDYFDFVAKCRNAARTLSQNPVFRWEEVDKKELRLLPANETNSHSWEERTRRMLKITGGNLSAYAVKLEELEERNSKPFLPWNIRNKCEIEIESCDPAELTLELSELPEPDEILFLEADSRTFEAQHRALERLQKNPNITYHRALLHLFTQSGLSEKTWPQVDTDGTRVRRWHILNKEFPGAEAQMDFVRKALSTPDYMLLKGPPGSGKTTAISELILQIADQKPDAHVLLTASTHVAIDNVLMSLADKADRVTCVRIASENTSKSVTDQRVVDMLLPNIVKRERDRISKALSGKPSEAARTFRATIELADHKNLRDLIITSATLAAGTPRGILSHPFIRPPDNHLSHLNNIVPFDFIIIDEASKTSLLEFLVAGIYAKRWIIVGDDCQLPPFMGRSDVGAALRVLTPDANDNEIENVAGNLVRWRERYFQKNEGALEDDIPLTLKESAQALRRIFLPSIYGLLSKGHGLGGESVLNTGLPIEALNQRSVSLNYQNRMHPQISEYPRKSFYSLTAIGTKVNTASVETLLLDNPDLAKRHWKLSSYYGFRSIWWDVPSGKETGEENPIEAYVIANECIRMLEKAPSISIAVICFHKHQRRLIRKALNELGDESLSAAVDKIETLTVDSCQGREADVVFVSFSLPQGSMFMRDPNRLNVAITRARHQLVLVGNHDGMLRQNRNWHGADHLQGLAEHHRNKKHTDHDLLRQAMQWSQRRPEKGAPKGQPQTRHPHQQQRGPTKPWRKPQGGPPSRMNNPFDGLDPGSFKR